MTKYTHIVIHYSELGIKKGNRSKFESQLIRNISQSLDQYVLKVHRRYGIVVCILKEDLKEKDLEDIKNKLSQVIGISFFAFVVACKKEISEITSCVFDLIKEKEFTSFKINSRRSNKQFPYSSQQINEIIGAEVVKHFSKKVDLTKPDLEIFIEVTETEVFVYTEKNKGVCGLPIGSSGTVICSLSGGIDSPVSAYYLMTRGCKVVFVHILSGNLQVNSLKSKIFKICETLSKFQNSAKLYVVPFSEIQKQIITFVPADYRMIVYRRYMLKIMCEIAKKENAKAIVTGDSVGQVASQTLDNLACIYDASTLPIFSPLIGLNKEEIISVAKKIGTYELSILPYPDCCSFMVDKHPQTKAKLKDVLLFEKNILDSSKLILDAVVNADCKKISVKD